MQVLYKAIICFMLIATIDCQDDESSSEYNRETRASPYGDRFGLKKDHCNCLHEINELKLQIQGVQAEVYALKKVFRSRNPGDSGSYYNKPPTPFGGGFKGGRNSRQSDNDYF